MKKTTLLLVFFVTCALFFVCACQKQQAKMQTPFQQYQATPQQIEPAPQENIEAEPFVIVKPPVNEPQGWSATISAGELLEALDQMGEKVASLNSLELVSEDDNVRLTIGGKLIQSDRLFSYLRLPSATVNSIDKIDGEYVFLGLSDISR